MEVRFAILPKAAESRVIGSLAKQVSKGFKCRVVVDNKKRFPHLTLFVLDVRKDKLKGLEKKTRELLRNARSFQMKAGGYWSIRGFVVLDVKSNRELFAVRKKLYGRKLRFKYSPHFTLARLKDLKNCRKMINNAPKFHKILHADSVALCLSDRNSQVYKIIKKFKLK